MAYTNLFGGTVITPAQPQYEAITLSEDITLVWPLESAGGVPYVAGQIYVDPTGNGFQIAMPPANQGSTGIATIITNVGADTFEVTDNSGGLIATVATTVSWIITLIDNSTVAGVWRAYQLGSTSSSAVAAALAGYGLQASGTQLQINWPTIDVAINTNIGASGRSTLFLATAPGITLTLAGSATVGVGFICAFANQSDGSINLATTGGETINGAASPLVIPSQASGFIICQAGNFNIVGVPTLPLPVTLGGTGASTATLALENLGGTAIGIDIFTAANAAAVNALLGQATPWTEVTTGVGFVAQGGKFYVCTAALTATLPLTTGLGANSVVGIFAQGGLVTIAIQATDQVGGQVEGAGCFIGEGGWALFLTDAAGNWWPLLGGNGFRDPAAGTPITLTVTDQIVRITTSVATTVNLCPVQTGPVTIKDKTGQAAVNAITVVPPAGTIDGAANLIINNNFGAATIVGPLDGTYGQI